MIIVIDEYGVTAGLVTLRDLIDRLAGELPDETESASPMVQWLPDGSARVDGLTLLSDIEEWFGIQVEEKDIDTLGGLLFDQLGRRPVVGDGVVAYGHAFEVEELDGLRIARVRVRRGDDANGAAENLPADFISTRSAE